ncbi:MAG: ABC transporter permease [Acidobacteria bacterium]|nr:MAG: ABC transporter permease [Acidobacteriota bacterium]
MQDFLRLLRYASPYLGKLLVALVCAALASLMILALASLVPPLVNDVLASAQPHTLQDGRAHPVSDKFNVLDYSNKLLGEGWIARYSSLGQKLVAKGRSTTFLTIAALVLILYLVKGILTYFSTYYVRAVGLQVILDLRRHLYDRIQRQSPAFFSSHPTGLLISRLTSDIARMQRTVSGDLADVFRLSFIIVGQVLWVFYLYPRLSAVCLVILPLVLYPIVRFGKRLKITSRTSQEKMADVTNILKETITGNRIVKGFGMEEYEVHRFTDALKKVQRQELRGARLVSLSPPIMEMVGALAAALLIGYGGYQISRGAVNAGEFSSFLFSLAWLYASVKNLAKINNDFQQSMAATRRVFEMMDADVDVKEKPGAPLLPPFREIIEFKDVAFRYNVTRVLEGVNLTVRCGQIVAIVGGSGAGKTTLVNLLPRFYDVTEGVVTIDGRDIRGVTLVSLRAQIALVTQEILLFDDTVRNNIAYGRQDVPLTEVEAAARTAFAHDFILRLPLAYDTRLGEAGHLLSVGERQRISIARALLKNSPILILDEATSALDTESEAMVQKALNNLMRGRTVFVIAHRLSTVRNADLIMVLEGGRIVEQGNHEALLERRGAYARLYELQFREGTGTHG